MTETARATRTLHVFFDVDYTILGGYDASLRPHTVEVFERLREDGHDVYVWSGEGERWPVVRTHGLEHLVSGVYGKPLHDYRERLEVLRREILAFGLAEHQLDPRRDDAQGIVHLVGDAGHEATKSTELLGLV